jgi:ribosome-associated translation inhibitor RaiA
VLWFDRLQAGRSLSRLGLSQTPQSASPFSASPGWAAVTERELVVQIQVNTDDNIEGGEELSARISTEIHTRLDRFSQHITRIEVHLSDENADKSAGSDKRCLIEARLEGRQPEVASDQAPTLEGAYSGAAKKLQRVLESTLGKLGH